MDWKKALDAGDMLEGKKIKMYEPSTLTSIIMEEL
jgi:hypothetical protein